jgi:hypothetical protein
LFWGRNWGNYDANVLGKALDIRGKTMTFFNRSKGPDEFISTANTCRDDNFVRFIVHYPSRKLDGHWVALSMINGLWYNLDSFLDEPELLHGQGREEDLKLYMEQLYENYEGDAIVISKKTESNTSDDQSGECGAISRILHRFLRL